MLLGSFFWGYLAGNLCAGNSAAEGEVCSRTDFVSCEGPAVKVSCRRGTVPGWFWRLLRSLGALLRLPFRASSACLRKVQEAVGLVISVQDGLRSRILACLASPHSAGISCIAGHAHHHATHLRLRARTPTKLADIAGKAKDHAN